MRLAHLRLIVLGSVIVRQRYLAAICRKWLKPGRDASDDAAMVVAQIRRTMSNQTTSWKAMMSDFAFVISTTTSGRLCDLPVLGDIGRRQIESIGRRRGVGLKAAFHRFITDAYCFLKGDAVRPLKQ
jgi:hypothetical protein